MKIAEPDNIKAGEQELINSIMEQLNSEIIESIASGRLAVNNLEFRNGDMIIHKNRIVYKMEFETSVAVSVMFDREGNLIDENDESIEDEPIMADSVSEDFAEMDQAGDEEEQIEENFDSGPDIDAFQDEVVDDSEETETDDEIAGVLAKTRDFWLKQSQEAMAPVEAESADIDDNQFQAVMQKNKNFWQEQVAAVSSE
jgi:hypothetical protein